MSRPHPAPFCGGSVFRAGMGLGFLLALVSAVTGIRFFGKNEPSPTTSTVQRTWIRIGHGAKPLVQGTVVDRSGEPIAGASVSLFREGGEATSPPLLEKKTAPQGSFAFTDLEEGAYRVQVAAPGKRRAHAGNVRLGASARGVNLRFILGEGRELAGVVRDAARAPASGRAVTARATNENTPPYATTTDADGSFQLEGLGDGPYDLIVEGEGTVTLTKRTAEVRRTEIGECSGPGEDPR